MQNFIILGTVLMLYLNGQIFDKITYVKVISNDFNVFTMKVKL